MPVGCEASRADHSATCDAGRMLGGAKISAGIGAREGDDTAGDVEVARADASMGASARADEPAKHATASTVMVCSRIAGLRFNQGRSADRSSLFLFNEGRDVIVPSSSTWRLWDPMTYGVLQGKLNADAVVDP